MVGLASPKPKKTKTKSPSACLLPTLHPFMCVRAHSADKFDPSNGYRSTLALNRSLATATSWVPFENTASCPNIAINHEMRLYFSSTISNHDQNTKGHRTIISHKSHRAFLGAIYVTGHGFKCKQSVCFACIILVLMYLKLVKQDSRTHAKHCMANEICDDNINTTGNE